MSLQKDLKPIYNGTLSSSIFFVEILDIPVSSSGMSTDSNRLGSLAFVKDSDES